MAPKPAVKVSPKKTNKKKKGGRPVKVNKKAEPAQAPALTRVMWQKWLEFVRQHAGPRVYFALWLTGEFGLRIREALCLTRADFRTEADPPYLHVKGEIVGAQKSPGRIYIRPTAMKGLRTMFDKGVAHPPKMKLAKECAPKPSPKEAKKKPNESKKRKRTSADAKESWQDEADECKAKGPGRMWQVPKQGFIFKARSEAKQKHLHYNAIYNQCVRLAPAFLRHLEKDGAMCDADIARLRPHSGRATFITQLMAEGQAVSITLKMARHKPSSIKTHIRYGQLTLEDMRNALEKSLSPGAPCHFMVRIRGGTLREASRADLLLARTAVQAELNRRG